MRRFISQKSIFTQIFFFTIAAVFCIGILFFSVPKAASALTSTTINSATKVGNGEELWDSGTKKFNKAVIGDLADKLFGENVDDIVSYVKSGTVDSGSHIISASTINAKAGNSTYGLTVKLGGLTWMITSLTLTDIGEATDQVVVTLYLAEPNGESVFRTPWSNTQGMNMYSSSILRKNLLHSDTYEMFASGDFAEEFLVQPKYIKYQETQTQTGRANKQCSTNMPNEAWGNIYTGWQTNYGYLSSAVLYGVRYDEWKNDYIWIPSETEVGAKKNLSDSCIWKLSQSQRECDDGKNIWLRSGAPDQYGFMYVAHPDFVIEGIDTAQTCRMRPAIHLNLTAANILQSPTDVSTEYNGQNQDLTTLAEKPKWYKAEIYEDPSKIQVTYAPAAVKNAGEYTVTIKILDEKLWGNAPNESKGEDETTRVFKFTITKKKISINIKSDADDIPVSVETDPTQLCESGGVRDPAPNFALIYGGAINTGGAELPTAEGEYFATAKITDENSNYEIDTSGTSYYAKFYIKSDVTKPYIGGGEEGAAEVTAQYKGSGKQLEFPVYGVTTGVKITTAGSGISFDSTNNKLIVTGGVGTYTATVALANTASHQWKGGGKESYTLTVKVVPGDYDFSEVKWQYKNASNVWADYPSAGLTYKGSNYELRVTGLPAGVSVLSTNYSNNQKKDAGTYTAKVTAITESEPNNYNAVNVNDISAFTFAYTINKVQVTLAWSTSEAQVDGNTVIIPSLPSDNAAYTVVYYSQADFNAAAGEPNAGATALTLNQITYDATAEKTYYAYATLSSNVTYQNNYELVGTKFNAFTVGGGKTAIIVTLGNDFKTYDATPFAAIATAAFTDGSPANVDLRYEYYNSDGTTKLASAPTDAGTYCVKVFVGQTNAGEYAVSGTSMFVFTIGKADYDLSGLRWKVGSETYALDESISYVYDGTVKTLTLAGLADVTGGLEVKYGGDYSKKDAGRHTVTLTVKQDDKNYNPCGLPASITWEITRKSADLSALAWNYDSSKPFVYERDESGAVVRSVSPVLPEGLPQELIDVITGSYGGTYQASGKGTYTATAGIIAALQGNASVQNNYNLTLPASFPASCVWKIQEKEIDMPVYDGSFTVYDGGGHDLAAACGLPADWRNYLDLTVFLTPPNGSKQPYAGYEGQMHVGYDAGEYELVFSVKSGVNTSADFNVWIGDDDTQTVTVAVSPRTITVSGWKGTGTRAQAQFADGDVLSEWYKYVVYDSGGNAVTPDGNTGKYAAGTYSRTVESTSPNIEIKFAGAQAVAFTVDETGGETGADTTAVERPVFNGGIEYTGKPFEITNENASRYFTGWNSEYMTVTSSDKGTDAGAYTVTVSLKNPVLTVWADDESATPAEITWTIGKAKLKPNWSNPRNPKFETDKAFAGMDLFEYVYYDANGNEVAKADLAEGEKYTVKAKLKAEHEKNFEFADADGNVLATPAISEGYEFEKGKSGGLNETLGLPDDFPLWQCAVIVVCALLLIIFIALWAKFGARRRKAKKRLKEYKTMSVGAFALLAVLDMPFLGLDNGMWTIIAGCAIGLTVAVFVGMLVARSMAKKAAEELEQHTGKAESDKKRAEKEEREQARLDREEERRRKEEEREQARLDREEERKRKEEEREEEKRRKEEERAEEKRRREEEREEEKRRREEEREERRLREEEQRAANQANAVGVSSAAQPAVQPQPVVADSFAAVQPQQPPVQGQPAVQQPIAQNQPAMQGQPVAVAAGDSDDRLAKLEEDMKRREETLMKELQSREDAMREQERKREEERLAQMRSDAEKEIARMKEEARKATEKAANSSDSDEKIKKLEEELQRREEQHRRELQEREDALREANRKQEEERLAQARAEAEKEIARMRADAMKAAEELKRQSELSPSAAQPAGQPAVQTVVSDDRVAKLEEEMKRRDEEYRRELQRRDDAMREADRKREEERLAQMRADAEKEIERMRSEAVRAAEEAKRQTSIASQANGQPVAQGQPVAVVSGDSDGRLAKLEEDMKRREEMLLKEVQSREDALRERERKYEEERREQERKREEERLAQMKADAEREAERIKEEARKAAEETKRKDAQVAPVQPATQSVGYVPPSVFVGTQTTHTEEDMDAETAAVLREYEERMRKMERELQEQRMTTLMREENDRARKEMEDAAKMRRHEEEMQRLRDLQEYERRQRQDMPYMQGYPQQPPLQGYGAQPYAAQPYGNGYAATDTLIRQQQELELQRLRLLEEQLKQKELENQLLRSQGYGVPQQPYPPQGYAGQYPPAGQQPYPYPPDPNGDKK